MRLDASDIHDLEPVIAVAVRQTIEAIQRENDRLGGRLGFTEREAAALIGVAPHVLADARRRGEIVAKRVGKKMIYSRQTLLAYLTEA